MILPLGCNLIQFNCFLYAAFHTDTMLVASAQQIITGDVSRLHTAIILGNRLV